MIWMASGLGRAELACAGTGWLAGWTARCAAPADSAKPAPQFLQNLSSGLFFPPHFGQKFTIILLLLMD
jgi:hypothetical protein